MGREVRRVALGWTPPEHSHYDETYAHAVQVWTQGKQAWAPSFVMRGNTFQDGVSFIADRRGAPDA